MLTMARNGFLILQTCKSRRMAIPKMRKIISPMVDSWSKKWVWFRAFNRWPWWNNKKNIPAPHSTAGSILYIVYASPQPDQGWFQTQRFCASEKCTYDYVCVYISTRVRVCVDPPSNSFWLCCKFDAGCIAAYGNFALTSSTLVSVPVLRPGQEASWYTSRQWTCACMCI